MSVMRVGDVTVQPILDGVAILPSSVFTVADRPADWTGHEHLLEDGMLRLPVGTFVVRTGDRVVMLDAGVAETDDPAFEGHALLDNLAADGIGLGEIDTIVVSHLHIDHCGWLATDEGPVFPNATVWIGAADWTYFIEEGNGGRRRARRLRGIEDRIRLVDRDGESVAPGITLRSTPGHTPGHMSTVISSGAERMLVMGDALHCPAQLTESEWQFFYDVDKDRASRTREALLREAEEPGTQLLPSHFPGMAAARLVPANGKKNWVLG